MDAVVAERENKMALEIPENSNDTRARWLYFYGLSQQRLRAIWHTIQMLSRNEVND